MSSVGLTRLYRLRRRRRRSWRRRPTADHDVALRGCRLYGRTTGGRERCRPKRSRYFRRLHRARPHALPPRRPERPAAARRAAAARACPGESYKLAFTPGLLAAGLPAPARGPAAEALAARPGRRARRPGRRPGRLPAKPDAQGRRPLPRERCRRPLVDSRPAGRSSAPTRRRRRRRAGARPGSTSSCRAATATPSARTPSSTSTPTTC